MQRRLIFCSVRLIIVAAVCPVILCKAQTIAIDPARRTFIVYQDISVFDDKGRECSLSRGDVITRLTDKADANENVSVRIASSKKHDCAVGKTVLVSVYDLAQMEIEFQRQLATGFRALESMSSQEATRKEQVNSAGPEAGHPSEVTGFMIDGVAVGADDFTQSGDGFQLRGNSDLAKTLSDGLHDIQKKAAAAQAAVSIHEFVWKEKLGLVKFEPYKDSYAVVIAIEDYGEKSGFPKLTGANKQCDEVAAELKGQGFVVKQFCGRDATRQNIEAYLEGNLAKKLGEDDRLLVYFGGHGYTVRNRFNENLGYLITYGATNTSVLENSIPMSRIQSEYVRMVPAKHVLFVLDACFSGLANTESSPPLEPSYLSYLEIKDLGERPSRAILTAGSGNDPGLNNNNGGIFTQAFLDGIRGAADHNRDGVITEHELLEYVRLRVIDAANRYGYRQVPQYNSLTLYGSGEFMFLKPVAPH